MTSEVKGGKRVAERCSQLMNILSLPPTPQQTLLLHQDNKNNQMVASQLLDPPHTPLVTSYATFLLLSQWNSPRASDLDLITSFFCISSPLPFPPPFLQGLGMLKSLPFKTTLPPLPCTHLSTTILTLCHT